jgi:hypothetical protein
MSSSYNVFYYTVFTVNPEEPITGRNFNGNQTGFSLAGI